MGHQEAYDLIFRKSDNSYNEPPKQSSTRGVILKITVMVHGDITGSLTTGSGNKINPRTSQLNFLILTPMQ